VRTYIGERNLKVTHDFGNNLASFASLARDPDPEAIEKALLDDPVGFMFEVEDAETAEDAAKLHNNHLYETLFDAMYKRRRRPVWAREWRPYCLTLRDGGTWIMLGREYKRLGTVQSQSADWCDWDAPDHVVWEFDCGDPRELLAEGIFCEASPNNHPKSTRLYLPFDGHDYGRRVARLVRATVDPPRYTRLLLSRCGFDPPPPKPSAMAA
jgi:hypothetical protein